MSHPKQSIGDARARETRWTGLMLAGLDGDAAAYRTLLEDLTPMLRTMARGGLARAGLGNADVEDVVQEILLAIHLKRGTWMRDQPFAPWANAIARHKLIDAMRRRGRRAETPIDDLIEILPDATPQPEKSASELSRIVMRLEGREQDVVQSISLDGKSIRDTAARLMISEGAVRVALHRGLKRLAKLYRDDDMAEQSP
ncbi:MAG: sigma-70 family RNA polymerase sigma factor [Alphaproteobacteria bacterium]|nr:sigma-70 family RNA polymerase sigma factor [Alphaproteobacteria bacterium]